MFQYVYLRGKAKLQQYCGNERGQGLTEYAAILAIVVIIAVLVTGDNGFQQAITTMYSKIATKLGVINTNIGQ